MKNDCSRDVSRRRHKMSYPARHELLSSLKERYLTAGRQEKRINFDIIITVTYNKK